MRNNGKGIGFGIFLLTAGAIWLLAMAKIVTWSTLGALFTLWPLILVAVGVGFIFRNNGVIRTLAWLVLLAVVICYGYFYPSSQPWIKYDLHFGDGTNTVKYSKVTLEKQPQTEKGELVLDYGALQVNIDSGASGLLDASIDESYVKHAVELKDNGRTTFAKFEMKNKGVFGLDAADKLRSDFHLNKDVLWDIKVDTGAASGNLDLSSLKVEKLDIGTGVTKLKIDLGSCNTSMKIDAGASKIDITLPGDTGMKARIDGSLNSTNLEKQGWTKKDGWFYSPGYESKNYKIDTEIDSGVGSLSIVNR